MLERDVIKKIQKDLNGKPGVWGFKAHGSQMQRAGIPDLILCVYGQFVGIEVKTETGKLSKLQDYTLKEIREIGRGISMLVMGYDDFVKKFDLIYNACRNIHIIKR